jgi:hypothetical protein
MVHIQKIDNLTYSVNDKIVKAFGFTIESEQPLTDFEKRSLNEFLLTCKRLKIRSTVKA